MSSDDIRYLSISELGEHYRQGDLSPVEVTEAHLEAIDRSNDRSHDYITVTRERALADAAAAESALQDGLDSSPLLGVPIGLKDLVDTAGIATSAGTKIWKDRIPDTDATVARRLADAGSILLGKTNLVEFAFGPYGISPHYGTPPNPWKADCVPGGSSSGSGGAVARGCAFAAIGTDTGGSIRLPGAFCGIVGLKPTVQRVSRAGVVPLSWTLDSVGPLTRTVKDAAIVFDAIAGPDPSDPVTVHTPAFSSVVESLESERALRLGLVRDPFFDGADADVVQAVEAAVGVLREAGVQVEEIDLPGAREELDAEIDGRGSVAIMCVEGYACHRETLGKFGDDVDPRIRSRIEIGKDLPAADYAIAIRDQGRLKRSVIDRMKEFDALIAPTTLTTAPRIEDVSKAPARLTTRLVNYLGLCSVSVPCGFGSEGLPVGLQFIGNPFDEGTILAAASVYESATTWHLERPPNTYDD